MSKKADHPLLAELLATANLYRAHLSTDRRLRRQRTWIIELAHNLRLEDDTGHRRKARQVKREVKTFLKTLDQEAAERPEEASIIQHILQTVSKRWKGLFICYRIPGLPATNNDQERFFRRLKHHQRRISGHKSVHDFIIRYGTYAADVDRREIFEELLARLSKVTDEEFQAARQAWRENEAPLHKAHRFRCNRVRFLKELEGDWEKLARK